MEIGDIILPKPKLTLPKPPTCFAAAFVAGPALVTLGVTLMFIPAGLIVAGIFITGGAALVLDAAGPAKK